MELSAKSLLSFSSTLQSPKFNKFNFLYLFLFYVNVIPEPISMYHVSTVITKTQTINPLELELQTVISCHVSAVTQIWIMYTYLFLHLCLSVCLFVCMSVCMYMCLYDQSIFIYGWVIQSGSMTQNLQKITLLQLNEKTTLV